MHPVRRDCDIEGFHTIPKASPGIFLCIVSLNSGSARSVTRLRVFCSPFDTTFAHWERIKLKQQFRTGSDAELAEHPLDFPRVPLMRTPYVLTCS